MSVEARLNRAEALIRVLLTRIGQVGSVPTTAGSVVFIGATGNFTQDNANLFYDDTNNRLGVGTATPTVTLDAFNGSSAVGVFRISRSTSNYIEFLSPGGTGFPMTFKAVTTNVGSIWTASSSAFAVGDLTLGATVASPNMVFDNSAASLLLQTTGANAVADAASILELNSTTKAFLLPRMTSTQRDAIGSPLSGLLIYDATLNKLAVYGASGWEVVTSV